jgi:hypothetical protein
VRKPFVLLLAGFLACDRTDTSQGATASAGGMGETASSQLEPSFVCAGESGSSLRGGMSRGSRSDCERGTGAADWITGGGQQNGGSGGGSSVVGNVLRDAAGTVPCRLTCLLCAHPVVARQVLELDLAQHLEHRRHVVGEAATL